MLNKDTAQHSPSVHFPFLQDIPRGAGASFSLGCKQAGTERYCLLEGILSHNPLVLSGYSSSKLLEVALLSEANAIHFSVNRVQSSPEKGICILKWVIS